MAQHPQNPRKPGWEIPYNKHISEQEANMLQYLQIHRTCRCDLDVHQHERTAMACGHCHQQDPTHPAGIVRMPKGYFLCKRCLLLLENHKFKFAEEIATHCSACIWTEIVRIVAMDPALFRDLMPPGQSEPNLIWKK